MTPTKAEREELRVLLARVPQTRWEGDEAGIDAGPGIMVAVLDDAGDDGAASEDELRATFSLIPALRNNALALLDALDRAEATIARLTAEVTYGEMSPIIDAALDDGDLVSKTRTALTSFLEARKAGAVERTEG